LLKWKQQHRWVLLMRHSPFTTPLPLDSGWY